MCCTRWTRGSRGQGPIIQRLSARSGLSTNPHKCAFRPMTTCWRYFHTSISTSRRDGLKILGFPVTLGLVTGFVLTKMDSIFSTENIVDRSWYHHLHELGGTTLIYTRSQPLPGVLEFRQVYFGNCNRIYITNWCCSCMNPPPQEAQVKLPPDSIIPAASHGGNLEIQIIDYAII